MWKFEWDVVASVRMSDSRRALQPSSANRPFKELIEETRDIDSALRGSMASSSQSWMETDAMMGHATMSLFIMTRTARCP